MRIKKVALILVLIFLCIGQPVSARLMTIITPEELSEMAEVVIVGTVLEVKKTSLKGEKLLGNNEPVPTTQYRAVINVEDIKKGSAPKKIQLFYFATDWEGMREERKGEHVTMIGGPLDITLAEGNRYKFYLKASASDTNSYVSILDGDFDDGRAVEEIKEDYFAKVTRVIDGETLELETGEQVKLIGIDCPELDTEEGKRTKEFVEGLVEGKEVRLEFDVQQKDKYGRLLAYVWYNPTVSAREMPMQGAYYDKFGIFINATIIKSGYASPMTVPPNVKYADLFQKLYQEARENKRGLWKESEATAVCPQCGAKDGVRIVYGKPGRELIDKAERGEIALGGCIVTDNDPQWACKTCNHRW